MCHAGLMFCQTCPVCRVLSKLPAGDASRGGGSTGAAAGPDEPNGRLGSLGSAEIGLCNRNLTEGTELRRASSPCRRATWTSAPPFKVCGLCFCIPKNDCRGRPKRLICLCFVHPQQQVGGTLRNASWNAISNLSYHATWRS